MIRAVGPADILIVEDNAVDAEMVMHVLRQFDRSARLAWVKDGAQALEFLFAASEHEGREGSDVPRLVLLDLRLPRVSGIEVLRRLKGDERTRDVPVVVLTASKKDADARECFELGVSHYMAKPLLLSHVVTVLRTLGLDRPRTTASSQSR